jgi:hypothetical protein
MVVEHITLMTTMSDYRQQFIDLKFCDRLSIADAIVLVQFLGLTKAAAFISEVDPWCYPHDDTPATLTVRKYVHSSVDLAAHAGKTIARFTDASITEYLCSPLLVKKGDRPSLVCKPKSERSKSSPKAVVTAAATVARKPSSQPADLPIIEGIHLQNFRLPSPSSPPHLSSLVHYCS